MKISLKELANQFNLTSIGDSNHTITGVSSLQKANKNQLAFLANSKYKAQLQQTQAGIVVLAQENIEQGSIQGNYLVSKNPYVDYAKIAGLFVKKQHNTSGIHPTAILAKTAHIGKNVSIGAYCIIGENSIIGDNTILQTHITIEENCKIGDNCLIKSNTVVAHDCRIGKCVILHPGAVIGADGFGLARDKDKWIKVPQLGAVQIGDDCEIGANTTIDRGTLEDTILEHDVHLDNQIQIAHNVRIGAHTVMAGCSAVAGSAKIGKNCQIGGGVGILGHLQVCDNVVLQSMALVTHSLHQAGSYSSITPLQKTQDWRKNAVRFKHLDKLARKVQKLEKDKNDNR